jgi:uncharacterized OB-fold protein
MSLRHQGENAMAKHDGSNRLVASRHRRSGQCVFPSIPTWSAAAQDYESTELSPQASLYSFTVLHPSPKTGEKPFIVIYADFPERARVFGRLRMPEGERPKIGMQLRVVFESTADGSADFFFVPSNEVAA